jgi:signal transduction histidine kinase
VALAERIAVAAPLDDARLSANDRVSLPQMAQGSMLVAPLIAHGEAVGLVQLIDIDPRRVFSEQELSLAQAMANVVGTALENGYLYTALTHRAAQLEAAYNDLRDADRLTDEMIQNISHELRTPLTPIVGYIDMLLAGDLGALAEDQRRAMEVVHNHARLLSQMIESIVTVQTPSEPAQFRKLVDLGDIAASAIEAADSSAKRSGITLTLDVPDASARIYADEKQLLQVFDCLISNAIKFSPNGGEVKFRLRDIGQSVKVDVVDQGIGIPVEEHAKIWRRFYQVDGSTTRAFNGLGLGLSIVKQVIERHGGQVLLRSEPGQGSTFILILPKGEPILVSEPDATIALRVDR